MLLLKCLSCGSNTHTRRKIQCERVVVKNVSLLPLSDLSQLPSPEALPLAGFSPVLADA